MKKIVKYLLITTAMVIFLIPYTSSIHAGSSRHDAHKMKKSNSSRYKRRVKKKRADKLVILNIMPKSGKAREAGFDGSTKMESTTLLDSDFSLCAKASRGLIMLDNTMLKKCGGRAEGWSVGPGAATKMDHSKHNMK